MTVKEIIEREAAGGFASFAGMVVQGTIPVRQELANEFIVAFMESPAAPSKNAAPAPAKPGSRPSLAELKAMVRRLNVRFVEGAMVVDFEVGR